MFREVHQMRVDTTTGGILLKVVSAWTVNESCLPEKRQACRFYKVTHYTGHVHKYMFFYDSSTVFQPEWIVEWLCRRQTACRSVQQWTEILAVRVSWQPAENVGGSGSAASWHAPNTLGVGMKGGCKCLRSFHTYMHCWWNFITVVNANSLKNFWKQSLIST